MSRHLYFFFLLLFLSHAVIVSGQYYNTGTDPSKLKWLEIKNDRFQLIFPESYKDEGLLFTKALEKADIDLKGIFNEKKKRIPVIIHNYSMESNGSVIWAPRRMELFPTPEPDGMPLRFTEQLAVHELTHVKQMLTLENHFPKFFRFILGEQGIAIPAALLPAWYLEGHAVFNESYYTLSGRGRSASFQKYLKAISLEKESMYKYDKLVNGSYKDFIPNHYYTGYQVIASTINQYGTTIWNDALEKTAKSFFLLNPVNQSLKRTAGTKKKLLFKHVFNNLDSIWEDEAEKNKYIKYGSITKKTNKEYAGYFSPVFVDSSHIAAIKTSLDKTKRIVVINTADSTEHTLCHTGLMTANFLSFAAPYIVWTENVPDPRWEQRSYSIIKIYDISARKCRRLSHKTRYSYAAISPDGSTVAAVENTIDNKNSIVFIDTHTRQIKRTIPSIDNAFLQRPVWSDNMEQITFIALTDKGESLISYSPNNNTWKTLVAPSREDFQSAFIKNNTLYYVSSVSGTENGFMIDNNHNIKQLTNSRFGVTDLCLHDNILWFCDYSSTGNNICRLDLKEVSDTFPDRKSYFTIDRMETPPKVEPANIDLKQYDIKKYHKASHLFKTHSRMPFYTDINSFSINPTKLSVGGLVMSQNLLNTLTTTLGYEYDKQHLIHASMLWKGWYPVFEARFDYGSHPLTKISGDEETAVPSQNFTMTQKTYVPLVFSSGCFNQGVFPSLSLSYTSTPVKTGNTFRKPLGILYRLYLYNSHKYAHRDFSPSWAQIVDISYTDYPTVRKEYGSLFALSTCFYFPGGLPNSNLKVRYAMERHQSARFFILNQIPLPRGIKNMISENIDFYSVDYMSPLCYPDFHIGSILYIKRIRGGLFYDYAEACNNHKSNPSSSNAKTTMTLHSKGIELMADFHLLRIPYEICCGCRTLWLGGEKKPVAEFIFSMNIYGNALGRKDRMF